MTSSRLALLVTAAGGLLAYSVWSGDIVLPMVPPFDAAKDDAAVIRLAPAAADAPLARPVAALNPLSGLNAETFTAIVERPLFNPTRRPAPPPAPEVEPAELPEEPLPAVAAMPEVKPEDFSLLAITAVDGTATALVRWNPTNQVYHVKQGQPVSDWQLMKIGALDVTLGRDGKTLQLKLFQTFGPAAPPAGVSIMNPGGAQPPVDDESVVEPPPQPVSPQHN